jgi:predicted transcriptional regulator of viral defense system
MKHKTTSEISASLLSELNNSDKKFFTYTQAQEIFPNSNPKTVNELLRKMIDRGLIMRIKDSLYHIIPYDQNPEEYQPNWHLTASNLFGLEKYYIGYYSALSIHSLITQPALKEQMVTASRQTKKGIFVKDTEYQFIYHNSDHFFGVKNVWIDNFNKVKCSDVEKTIIDCLFMPEYASGIVEIAKAIFKVKDSLDFEKLYQYTIQFKSQAVVKRLGYLLELLKIENEIVFLLLADRTDSFIQLDPSLPKGGKMLSRWSVQINIDTETIKSALSH